jgi:hypothetical protein
MEVPDALFRKVKSRAAERGQTLREFVTAALEEKLRSNRSPSSAEPEWMAGFGKLRRLHKDTQEVQNRIRETFEALEPEDLE